MVAAETKTCTKQTSHPTIPTDVLVDRVWSLCQALSEKKHFVYQQVFSKRIIEAVLMHDGDMITGLWARQCVGADQVVLNPDGSACLMKESPNAWMTYKEKPVFSVKAAGGYELDQVTTEHQFATPKGYKQLKDLRVGDTVMVAVKQEKWLNSAYLEGTWFRPQRSNNFYKEHVEHVKIPWTKSLGKILGYMTSDGYGITALKNRQAPKFTSVTMRYLNGFDLLTHKVFPGIDTIWRKKGNGFDIYPKNMRRSNLPSPFSSMLRVIDWSHGFPKDIFNTNPQIASVFMNRMFAADGCVQYTAKHKGFELACGNDIVYARYAQALLLKLGIRACIKREHMQKNKDGTKFNRLCIEGGMNVLRFLDTIGDIRGKESKCRKLRVYFESSERKLAERYPVMQRGVDGEVLTCTKITSIRLNGYAEVWDRTVGNKGWFIGQGFKLHNSGKSQAIADTCSGLAYILPMLARSPLFENDWRFNCTDEQGNYRGYKNGIRIGIYAPIQEQADIVFTRIKDTLSTFSAKQIADDLGLGIQIANSNRIWMSNGSKIRAQSASEQSKIEGESYHLLVLDECQDINTTKIRQGLHPMVAAYNGTIVKIGTPSTTKSDFYTSIKTNERNYAQGGPKNHFHFSYKVCQQYNSMYREFIEKEKARVGEDADEFRISFGTEWILERGQFITDLHLKNPSIALVTGPYSEIWLKQNNRYTTQVAGIDFGKVHDPTVVTVVDVDWKNPLIDEWIDTVEGMIHFSAYQKHVVSWLMLLGDNYEDQFNQITAYLSNFKGLRKITLDATGVGQWGLDKFAVHYSQFDRGKGADGIPDYGHVEVEGIHFNQSTKSEIYKLLHSDLLSSRITFPAGEKTRKTRYFRRFIGELLDLRKVYRNGYMCCEAPDEPGAHDDFCTSFCLSNWGANKPADTCDVEVSTNFLFNR